MMEVLRFQAMDYLSTEGGEKALKWHSLKTNAEP